VTPDALTVVYLMALTWLASEIVHAIHGRFA
jgi:hypothetical protein